MIEIRFHGWGGQGAVIASNLLAEAFFIEGKDVQSFPYFGVERRGAPVTAFTRVDEKKIRIRSEIYEPDYVIVLDQNLLSATDVTHGLKKDGLVLVNTKKQPEELNINKVATIDATSIALKYALGTRTAPIVNTSILGAFAKVSKLVKLDSIVKSIISGLHTKINENVSAAKESYEKVVFGYV
ncbi:MAG: 2-oxoacid:acceptor oxidoreductase family protein [Candidatus Thermoplasmatota archaeon]